MITNESDVAQMCTQRSRSRSPLDDGSRHPRPLGVGRHPRLYRSRSPRRGDGNMGRRSPRRGDGNMGRRSRSPQRIGDDGGNAQHRIDECSAPYKGGRRYLSPSPPGLAALDFESINRDAHVRSVYQQDELSEFDKVVARLPPPYARRQASGDTPLSAHDAPYTEVSVADALANASAHFNYALKLRPRRLVSLALLFPKWFAVRRPDDGETASLRALSVISNDSEVERWRVRMRGGQLRFPLQGRWSIAASRSASTFSLRIWVLYSMWMCRTGDKLRRDCEQHNDSTSRSSGSSDDLRHPVECVRT